MRMFSFLCTMRFVLMTLYQIFFQCSLVYYQLNKISALMFRTSHAISKIDWWKATRNGIQFVKDVCNENYLLIFGYFLFAFSTSWNHPVKSFKTCLKFMLSHIKFDKLWPQNRLRKDMYKAVKEERTSVSRLTAVELISQKQSFSACFCDFKSLFLTLKCRERS